MKASILSLFICCMFLDLSAQQSKEGVLDQLDSQSEKYASIAQEIWTLAEMGYQEEKSSALLQTTLKDEGFSIKTGVADIPTAFIAEYGSGSPVIAILGEYDALPGLSQQAVPEKLSAGKVAGHACGHHLFGTASAAAAISVKNWMKANNITGTVRFYGCPAEEGGSGKVYMTRAGLFDDVDTVLHWHPSSVNAANPGAALANKSAKFRFHGVSAHAAGAPERGRSALDAVESMNYMINMMREHIPQDARIHYVITDGGKAPNVVPDYAEVYYYARHNKRDVVIDIFDRMINAAKGAALGTDTTMEFEMIGGTHELLPNLALQKLMYDNLTAIGGFKYSDVELDFANKISKSLGQESLDTKYSEGIVPYTVNAKAYGSTDVGDVSFTVPTVGLGTATWVPGTAAHSWQAVAAGGTSIGSKGMMIAAKALTATAMDLFTDTSLIAKAKEEFLKRRGADFKYIPLLGDRAPALNYRN
ncbi:MAG: amidohydrolase [Flavobacteriaceae bacterium]|nr:amidohydrolase [Flavobacteriaceae bacterium]